MKATFVVPFVNLTGGIRVILDYANWMHDAGHDVTCVYPTRPYRFQLTRAQHAFEYAKQAASAASVPWHDLRCRLRRVPHIDDAFVDDADIVVAAGWPTTYDVVRFRESRGRKVHIVFHHESGTGPERQIRGTYRLPFYRMAFSQFVRRSVARYGCAIADVVPNGVDTSRFFPCSDADPYSVLWLYHPDPRKGAADAIAALRRLKWRIPELRVTACGTVRPPHLPSWMSFAFHVSDDCLRRYYSSATVLLYPSRHEGFGLPPLEAMTCGCPSVTTAVGAIGEYATDRHDALVVAPGDVDAMVDRLEEVLDDAALRRRLSTAGLATAQRFALSRVAPLFADALERARTSPPRYQGVLQTKLAASLVSPEPL